MKTGHTGSYFFCLSKQDHMFCKESTNVSKLLIQTKTKSLLTELLKFADHIWMKTFNADCLSHWSVRPDLQNGYSITSEI